MKIDTSIVRKTISQVRSEMRYYQERSLPGFDAELTSRAIAEFEEQIPNYGVKLRLEGIENLERLKVVKELNKLNTDISNFEFKSDEAAADSLHFPIVQSLRGLTEVLQYSQPQRKPPKVVERP